MLPDLAQRKRLHPAVLAAAALSATAVCGPLALGWPAAARADDGDRALQGLAAPPLPAPRTAPPTALEWSRRLQAPGSFGPPPLREVDAALLAAARQARWAEVLRLVRSGQDGERANVQARDEAGAHVLVMAARAGQDELLRELLARGAEIDRVGDDGFSALGAAAFAGRRSTVRLLLRAGADAQRWGASGQTALHLAALAGRIDTLDELLRLKVDIETLNRQRESALDVAAAAGQQASMERLIQGGADGLMAGRR